MASAALRRSVARNIARTMPRLFVQDGLHGRRSGPRPALRHAPSFSRLFSSSPAPPTSSPPPPPQHKDLLTKVENGLDCVVTTMGYSVLFGGVIFIYGWMKPAVEEIREGFAVSARERSNMKDEIIRDFQMVHEQFNDLKETITAGIDSMPASSQSQAHKPQDPVQGNEPDGCQAF